MTKSNALLQFDVVHARGLSNCVDWSFACCMKDIKRKPIWIVCICSQCSKSCMSSIVLRKMMINLHFLKFLDQYMKKEGRSLFILYCKYHGSRWPDHKRGRDQHNHGIDLVLIEYFSLNTWRIDWNYTDDINMWWYNYDLHWLCIYF